MAVPINLKPDKYKIIVEERRKNKRKKSEKLFIKVKSGGFSVAYIDFPEDKKDKIGSPLNEREKKLIRAALKTETPVKMWEGNFVKPLNKRITGVFGSIRKMGDKVLWQHRGVDFSAKVGTPVTAPEKGKVILTGEDFNLHGKTVMLDHGLGVISIYIHLHTIDVKEGDIVKQGQVIGTVGNTGLTTAPNLHWGVYIHSNVVNPLWWLERQ